eukprot:2144033-Prymnesium_polylepis.2
MATGARAAAGCMPMVPGEAACIGRRGLPPAASLGLRMARAPTFLCTGPGGGLGGSPPPSEGLLSVS